MPTKPKPQLPNQIRWPRLIRTAAEAAKFIDAVGYCVLYPANNVPLPSLYYAVTHRDPHVKVIWDKLSQLIWRWKDELPSRGRAVYVKYFRARGTFISLPMLPYFLAMRDVAVSPGDFDRFYSEGRIRDDARAIWEALATHGPLATLELRNACKMDTKAGNARFKRAIADLQCLLVVIHSGTEQETEAWASGRFELTCRAFPKQTTEARRITPEEARAALAAKYLEWHPTAPAPQLARLFQWTKPEAAAALAAGARDHEEGN